MLCQVGFGPGDELLRADAPGWFRCDWRGWENLRSNGTWLIDRPEASLVFYLAADGGESALSALGGPGAAFGAIVKKVVEKVKAKG